MPHDWAIEALFDSDENLPQVYKNVDMIGIYTYNNNADTGFINIDRFKYDVSNN